jgi:hypothetical protein
MYNISAWIQPRNESEAQTTIKAETLLGYEKDVVSECYLTIAEWGDGRIGKLTILMTNVQAKQMLEALTAHLESNANA